MKNCVEVRGVRIGEGIPKICVPIVGKTQEEILSAAVSVRKAAPDLIEWRADCFEAAADFKKVEAVLKELRRLLEDIPLLFTFRTAKEGGEGDLEKAEYAMLNQRAASTGFVDLIDVELFTGEDIVSAIIAGAHDAGVRVIASNHDFHGTPGKAELIKRLCEMQRLGADILKIAVMPKNRQDVLTLLAATDEMAAEHASRPVVTMSMSATGLISRLGGEVFGSAITFGAVGKTSAPGQIEAADLRTVLEVIHKNQQTDDRIVEAERKRK